MVPPGLRGAEWVLLSAVGLGGLIGYLLLWQTVEPGFTEYWGYMIGQLGVLLAGLLVLHACFRRQGGLAWYTHLMVTGTAWVDTLGNAGHLYERYSSYDKITHFGAGIAITAGAADLLRALGERGLLDTTLAWQLAAAVTITLVLNVGWETYEYLGDSFFGSTRHQGALDTIYDFVSDIAGALVAVLLVVRAQRRPVAADRQVVLEPTRA